MLRATYESMRTAAVRSTLSALGSAESVVLTFGRYERMVVRRRLVSQLPKLNMMLLKRLAGGGGDSGSAGGRKSPGGLAQFDMTEFGASWSAFEALLRILVTAAAASSSSASKDDDADDGAAEHALASTSTTTTTTTGAEASTLSLLCASVSPALLAETANLAGQMATSGGSRGGGGGGGGGGSSSSSCFQRVLAALLAAVTENNNERDGKLLLSATRASSSARTPTTSQTKMLRLTKSNGGDGEEVPFDAALRVPLVRTLLEKQRKDAKGKKKKPKGTDGATTTVAAGKEGDEKAEEEEEEADIAVVPLNLSEQGLTKLAVYLRTVADLDDSIASAARVDSGKAAPAVAADDVAGKTTTTKKEIVEDKRARAARRFVLECSPRETLVLVRVAGYLKYDALADDIRETVAYSMTLPGAGGGGGGGGGGAQEVSTTRLVEHLRQVDLFRMDGMLAEAVPKTVLAVRGAGAGVAAACLAIAENSQYNTDALQPVQAGALRAMMEGGLFCLLLGGGMRNTLFPRSVGRIGRDARSVKKAVCFGRSRR